MPKVRGKSRKPIARGNTRSTSSNNQSFWSDTFKLAFDTYRRRNARWKIVVTARGKVIQDPRRFHDWEEMHTTLRREAPTYPKGAFIACCIVNKEEEKVPTFRQCLWWAWKFTLRAQRQRSIT